MADGLHLIDETIKQGLQIMGPRTCLRVPLEAECRTIDQLNPLQAAIEQRAVSGSDMGGQTLLVNSKTMILTGNQHPSGVQFLHGMVGAMMTEFHLHRSRPCGQPQQLMPQTDAKNRNTSLQKHLDG